MIKTPRELAIFIGFLFSLLIAFAEWGTTYNMWYDEDDTEHKTTARHAALRAGFIMFTILMIFVLALVFLLPVILSRYYN